MNRTTTAPERVLLSILIVILLVLLLAACGGKRVSITVPARAQAGDLVDMQSCTYEDDDVESAADCGTLIASENWEAPASRLIALPLLKLIDM